MVSVTRNLLKNLVHFGPFGQAEDLTRQIKFPWEIKGIVNSITIKTREWRGKTIVQGFQIHTQEGSSKACGMNYNDIRDTVTFDIPDDRHICQVRLAAASYIQNLAFVLDDGMILGPVGGSCSGTKGTGKQVEFVTIPPTLSEQLNDKKHSTSILCGISGLTVHSEKGPVVARVVFAFTEF